MGRHHAWLTRAELEAMREIYGLYHHGQAQDLKDDLRQIRRTVRLGMSLRACASARSVPLGYAKVLRRYVEHE